MGAGTFPPSAPDTGVGAFRLKLIVAAGVDVRSIQMWIKILLLSIEFRGLLEERDCSMILGE